jgi:hypothetical protein
MNGTVPWKAELPWRSITHSNREIAHFADATLKHIAHPEFAPDLPGNGAGVMRVRPTGIAGASMMKKIGRCSREESALR